MFINANYVLIAMVGNQQLMFQYETSSVWDALDEFWHEDWTETIAGGQDDGVFPIDVYALSEAVKVIRKYQFTFNFCVFRQYFDKGYLRTDDGGSKTYTLDEFVKHIERKERKEPNDTTSFFYYMWNAWSKEECQKAFKGGPTDWEHIWNKWCGICSEHSVYGAAERLYAELSKANRDLLVKRALEVYDGDSRIDHSWRCQAAEPSGTL